MSMHESGLRELKKRMTRDAIAAAALRLAQEKGLAGVTIEEIAQEAIVSPRTVSNYFDAKEQAIVVAGTPDWDVVVDTFLAAPPGPEPLGAFRTLILQAVEELTPEALALDHRVLQLAAAHAGLRPFLTAEYDALGERLGTAIAAESGRTLYTTLVSAVASTALLAAQRVWATEPDVDRDRLTALIRDAFDRCAAGLAPPPSADETGTGGSPGNGSSDPVSAGSPT
jgi:AcrR family transcriptional regulator